MVAAMGLRVHADLVSLRRRTREAAERIGLPDRRVASLSAAVYEAARLLFARAGRGEADIAIDPGADLRVTVRVKTAEGIAAGDALTGQLRALAAAVDRMSIDESHGWLTVTLADAVPAADAPPLLSGHVADSGPDPIAESESRNVDPADDSSRMRRTIVELQSELDETNRGVMALYAELDAQAETLRQAEERLRVLLDSVHDYAICMLTLDGEIATWNAGAERLFGYAADHIIGRNVACFYAGADRDMNVPADHLRIAREEGRVEAECSCLRHGGSAFDALVLLTPVRQASGALGGFALVVRDITERKRLEENLRRRADDLAAANRAKEDFLATLSHELRTPLNAMLGWTRLLRMGKLDASGMTRALETIERNAHMQEQLIADILDVSRIVTGKLRLTLRPIELEPVIDASMDALRPAADAKGVRLSCTVSPSGTVMGDPDRLQQVIWNLLANAIKFTPAGGSVTVTVARAGTNAMISVADTGDGIGPTLLPLIFDRFTQGDGSVTRAHGGLGLGLSIVRHIVELHGGEVSATSEGPGRGAVFTVLLPIRAVRQQPIATEGDEPSLSGLKVLVVDDDPDAREVVSTALALCGARTAAAASAREALQILVEFRPDVLVSDINMPGEDGYALIRRVRALETDDLGAVPAVALTGLGEATARRLALTAGYQQFVPKPVEADELAAVVRTLALARR
jgi:PAS domain S-box-containing protein